MPSRTLEPTASSSSTNTLAAPTATPPAQRTLTPTAQPSRTPTQEPAPTLSASPTLSPLALSVSNVSGIKRLATWGQGVANATAWSHDGVLIAVGTSAGVYIYDTGTLAQLRFISTDAQVQSVAFSPHDNILATGTSNIFYGDDSTIANHVLLWNPRTGAKVAAIHEPAWNGVMQLAYSADGYWLAATGVARSLRSDTGSFITRLGVWQTSGYELVNTTDAGGCGDFGAFAFSPDSRSIALADCGGVNLLDIATGDSQQVNVGGEPDHVAFGPHGASLLVSTYDGGPSEVALSGTAATSSLPLGEGWFQLSPDGNSILINATDNPAGSTPRSQLFDLVTGQTRWFSQTLDLQKASFSPDASRVATIGADDSLQVWSTSSLALAQAVARQPGAAVLTFGPFASAGNSLQEVLAAGTAKGQVFIIDPDSRKVIRSYQVGQETIEALALDPSGQLLAVASRGYVSPTLTLLNAATGQTVQAIDVQFTNDYSSDILGLAFSADSQSILAKTSEVPDYQGWNIATGQRIANPQAVLWANGGDVNADAQGHLITVSFDEQNAVFSFTDQFSGRLLAAIPDDKLAYPCQFGGGYALSADARYLGMGCDWPVIRVWDLQRARLADSLAGHRVYTGDGAVSSVLRVIFAPSGYLLVSSGADGTVRFWDVQSGKASLTLHGHNAGVGQLESSPDGRYVATASDDGIYDLWGVQP